MTKPLRRNQVAMLDRGYISPSIAVAAHHLQPSFSVLPPIDSRDEGRHCTRRPGSWKACLFIVRLKSARAWQGVTAVAADEGRLLLPIILMWILEPSSPSPQAPPKQASPSSSPEPSGSQTRHPSASTFSCKRLRAWLSITCPATTTMSCLA